MNYISLFKERSFIMTATYSITINIIVDCKTLKIVMLVNPTKKILKVIKKSWLSIIYKYTDAIYIIINMPRTLIVLATTVATASVIDPLTSI